MRVGTFILAALLLPAVLCKSRGHRDEQGIRVNRQFATTYLIRFGYMSPKYRWGRFYRRALGQFQRLAHLPVTFKLDKATRKQMAKKRCGETDKRRKSDGKRSRGRWIKKRHVYTRSKKLNRGENRPVYVRPKGPAETKGPDISIAPTASKSLPVPRWDVTPNRRRRFVLSGPSWSRRSLKYFLKYYSSSDLTHPQQDTLMALALKYWSDVTPLTFTQVFAENEADIKISFPRGAHGDGFPFDGPNGIVAHAADPEDGRVHFDGDETFTNGSSVGVNLLFVAVHEFGHSLGLDHSNVQDAIMFPFYRPYNPNVTMVLHADDIAGIQEIYGAPGSGSLEVCQDKYNFCRFYVEYCADWWEVTLREDCPRTCGLC